MSTQSLICMVGLPRSGKSTCARELAKELGAPIVNRDSIRLALHGERYISLAEPMVHAVTRIMVGALFAAGHSHVILDETNIMREHRDSWLDERWNTYFLWIKTSSAVCIERAERENDTEIIPVIERMAASFVPLEADEPTWLKSVAEEQKSFVVFGHEIDIDAMVGELERLREKADETRKALEKAAYVDVSTLNEPMTM